MAPIRTELLGSSHHLSLLHPGKLRAGTWELGRDEKENHLNQAFILGFKMFIFRGVSNKSILWYLIQWTSPKKQSFQYFIGNSIWPVFFLVVKCPNLRHHATGNCPISYLHLVRRWVFFELVCYWWYTIVYHGKHGFAICVYIRSSWFTMVFSCTIQWYFAMFMF